MIPPVEVQAGDDGRQVRLQPALALELPEDCVVVRDELLLDNGREFVSLLARAVMTTADGVAHPLDEGELGKKELLGSHTWAPRGCAVNCSILSNCSGTETARPSHGSEGFRERPRCSRPSTPDSVRSTGVRGTLIPLLSTSHHGVLACGFGGFASRLCLLSRVRGERRGHLPFSAPPPRGW